MDHYVKFGNNDIHMASILWSFGCIALFVLILGSLLGRSLNNDFANIELISRNRKAKRDQRRNKDYSEDEFGLNSNKPKVVKAGDVAWKKVQGDVFRKPDYAIFLCVLIGMGV